VCSAHDAHDAALFKIPEGDVAVSVASCEDSTRAAGGVLFAFGGGTGADGRVGAEGEGGDSFCGSGVVSELGAKGEKVCVGEDIVDVDLASGRGEGDMVEVCGIGDGGYLCAAEGRGTGVYQFPIVTVSS